MASTQVRDLAARLASDDHFREQFRSDARTTVRSYGIKLNTAELEALDAVDWDAMTDDELLVRVRGASARATVVTV